MGSVEQKGKEAATSQARLFHRRDRLAFTATFALAATVLASLLTVARLNGAAGIDKPAAHLGSARFKIDINKADWIEIDSLPTVGPKLAQQIVAWRQEHGTFASHEDLLAIHGLGPKKLEQFRPYLAKIKSTGTSNP